jgi:predicted anti-sigma-YlaC factor YlaD
VDCEVAREALSARLDGEREPVPSGRVDEHLEECAACRAWFNQVAGLARDLHQLVQARQVISPVGAIGVERVLPVRPSLVAWQRWALLCVGIAQIVLGIVQGLGLSVGLTHDHETGSGIHLLNESTSWSIALGVVMVGLPVVVGAVLAFLVWRSSSAPRPTPGAIATESDIMLPQNASRGRRRGHLWPTDGSAA